MTRSTDLIIQLNELWFEENCGIDWRFDEGSGHPWCVLLTWIQENSSPHGADFCEYTWEFYGHSLKKAVSEAIEWCQGLLALSKIDPAPDQALDGDQPVRATFTTPQGPGGLADARYGTFSGVVDQSGYGLVGLVVLLAYGDALEYPMEGSHVSVTYRKTS